MNLEKYRYFIPNNLRHTIGQRLIDTSNVSSISVKSICKYINWFPFLSYFTDKTRENSFYDYSKDALIFDKEPFYRTFFDFVVYNEDDLLYENDYYFKDWCFINFNKVKYDNNCIDEFVKNFNMYLSIYEDIKINGYKEIGEYPHGMIDSNGEFYLMGGRHRLTFCKLLNIEKINVKIIFTHEELVNRNIQLC
jgi:hypothetical protein